MIDIFEIKSKHLVILVRLLDPEKLEQVILLTTNFRYFLCGKILGMRYY